MNIGITQGKPGAKLWQILKPHFLVLNDRIVLACLCFMCSNCACCCGRCALQLGCPAGHSLGALILHLSPREIRNPKAKPITQGQYMDLSLSLED